VFWLTVIIKECHFHLFQAWWRKIQSLGLATEYKSEESVIGKWLQVFFGLSFLNSVLHLIYFLALEMIHLILKEAKRTHMERFCIQARYTADKNI
jgi:hypothetical protein